MNCSVCFHRLAAAAAAALFLSSAAAQTQVESTIKESTLPSPAKPAGRPSVALVLAGGGARGFAHIPVLELLEQEHIPIDMVVGNSAGAICGALYCAGYTPKQILEQMYEFSNGAVLKDNAYSPFEQELGDHSTLNAPVRINFGSMGQSFSLGMGNGVLTGQNAYELFRKLTVRFPSDMDFDDLPIPFRAVSTNLIKGQLEVLRSGDLAEAMRASMSIPGLFQPFEMNGQYYIDGLALDDTPIDVAVKMGYDIIIVSWLSDGMVSDPDKFDANPLVAVLQMINMDQALRSSNNKQFATLNIYPDYAGETLISYTRGQKIYNASKKSMEKYRDACRLLHDKFFSAPEAQPSAQERKYKASYLANSRLAVQKLSVQNADDADRKFITQQFNKIKGQEFTESDFTSLADTIYHTGKYRNVITRITGPDGDRTLDIDLRPAKKEYGIVLLSPELQGTLAGDSTLGFSMAADVQWRGLSGYGSVLSAKISAFNGFQGELMYRQPVGSRIFSQLTCGYKNSSYNTGSGWMYCPSSLMTIQKASVDEKIGLTLTGTKQVFATGTGFSWYNTEDAVSGGLDTTAGDFFGSYTLNTLDSTCFPTEGIYLSLQSKGVLPVQEHETVPIFNIETLDCIAAIPLGSAFNIIFDGFTGTDHSQQLNNIPGLKPVYGFTLADRRFFPQISAQAPWGIHKIAASGTLQFSPRSDLAVFGMKTMLFVSGAVGGIWDDYKDISMEGLSWRASFDAGLRIQDNFGILLRIGSGTSRGYIMPFISLDIGNIRF